MDELEVQEVALDTERYISSELHCREITRGCNCVVSNKLLNDHFKTLYYDIPIVQ